MPNDPDNSLLIKAISRHDDVSPMPPEKKDALRPEQIAAFKRWIREGAEWPATSEKFEAINHKSYTLGFLVLQLQRMVDIRSTYQETLEDMFQHISIRQHILDSYLSMMQLTGSHHLHRTRNLTGTVNAGYASFNLF